MARSILFLLLVFSLSFVIFISSSCAEDVMEKREITCQQVCAELYHNCLDEIRKVCGNNEDSDCFKKYKKDCDEKNVICFGSCR
jgi:uncharacterized membrane protein